MSYPKTSFTIIQNFYRLTYEKQDFAYSIMTLSLILYRKKEVAYQVSPL